MKIYVDADAAPRAVKNILYKAADRERIEVLLVANQPLYTPKSAFVKSKVVSKGFDVADEWIADAIEPGDLCITADIPLAAAVVENGGLVIDPRGEEINKSNASARLTMRNFMEEQREASQILSGGPSAYSDRDKRKFAGALDRWLNKTRAKRKATKG